MHTWSGWRNVSALTRAAAMSMALGAAFGCERDADEGGDAGAGELPGCDHANPHRHGTSRWQPVLRYGIGGGPGPYAFEFEAHVEVCAERDGLVEWCEGAAEGERPLAIAVPPGLLRVGQSYRLGYAYGGPEQPYSFQTTVQAEDGTLLLLALEGQPPFIEPVFAPLGVEPRWVPVCTEPDTLNDGLFETHHALELTGAGAQVVLPLGTKVAVELPGHGPYTAFLEAATFARGDPDLPGDFIHLMVFRTPAAPAR